MKDKNKLYDYISVNSNTMEELDKKVTKLLNEGYRLYGYPFFTNRYIIQTMIKTPINEVKHKCEMED